MKCAALFLFLSCASAPPPPTPPPTPRTPGPEVIAIVDKIERNGYVDELTNGTILPWTLVTLTVIAPEPQFGTVVSMYCPAHPFIAERPLLVGQRVKFLLPSEVEREGIAMTDVKELRFAE